MAAEAAADAGTRSAEAGGGGDQGAPAPDFSAIVPQLGELSTSFEERTLQGFQATALEEVQTEHAKYFDALQQHPRLLVGQQVPRIDGGEGFETLSSTTDAREWQEAVKHVLVQEIQSRASKQMDENREFLQTVHSSIELFQKNADLIPGAESFDQDLAERFTTLATPYELRVEGKLQGYSIPVQPIIDQIREQLITERQAAAAAAPAAPAAVTPQPPAEQPQAGIPAKAGNGSQAEDFSTLFGTIGLPNLQI